MKTILQFGKKYAVHLILGLVAVSGYGIMAFASSSRELAESAYVQASREKDAIVTERDVKIAKINATYQPKIDFATKVLHDARCVLVDAKIEEMEDIYTEKELKENQDYGRLEMLKGGYCKQIDPKLSNNEIITWNGITAQSRFIDKLKLADSDYFNATGKHITTYSSFRTEEEQRAIRTKFGYTSDTQSSGDKGLPKASPVGMSVHEKGLAMDVRNVAEVEPYLEKYGFVNNVAGDRDHFELYESVEDLTIEACYSKAKDPKECVKKMLAIFQTDSGKCTQGTGAITLNCGNMRPSPNMWDKNVKWVVYKTKDNGEFRAYSSLRDGIFDNVALYVGKYEGKSWEELKVWGGNSEEWLALVKTIYDRQI